MNNILKELRTTEFMSSTVKTPQYKSFHRRFKNRFKKYLESLGCTEVEVGKPNHFDISGFFTAPSGQIWYFSLSDLRWFKDKLLIRTAKHYKDWTGGHNQYTPLKEHSFQEKLERIIK